MPDRGRLSCKHDVPLSEFCPECEAEQEAADAFDVEFEFAGYVDEVDEDFPDEEDDDGEEQFSESLAEEDEDQWFKDDEEV